tara:strand:- start:480 stop:746 length:267 start_codon:yes stop_codon:yes gene_type:complete
MSDNNNTPNIVAEMSLRLAQIEGAFLFLDEMNNNSNRPRNITEQNTVARNLRRIREVRDMHKIITREKTNSSTTSNAALHADQLLHDS